MNSLAYLVTATAVGLTATVAMLWVFVTFIEPHRDMPGPLLFLVLLGMIFGVGALWAAGMKLADGYLRDK